MVETTQCVADITALGWQGRRAGGSLEGCVASTATSPTPRSTPATSSCANKETNGWGDSLAGLEASAPPSLLAPPIDGSDPSVGDCKQWSVGGCLGGPVASAAPPPHSNLHAPSCANGESVANSPKAGRASVVPLSLVSGAIG
jgi:hypothetical protein